MRSQGHLFIILHSHDGMIIPSQGVHGAPRQGAGEGGRNLFHQGWIARCLGDWRHVLIESGTEFFRNATVLLLAYYFQKIQRKRNEVERETGE